VRRLSTIPPLVALLSALSLAGPAPAGDSIVVASTTSPEHSGLFAHILPIFRALSGIEVRVVAQGTGQALATARGRTSRSCGSGRRSGSTPEVRGTGSSARAWARP
jgi:ABC-type tungstate transport system permease subunit